MKDEFTAWMRNRISGSGKNFPVRGQSVDAVFNKHYLSAVCIPDTSAATGDKMGRNLGPTGLHYSTERQYIREVNGINDILGGDKCLWRSSREGV